MLSFPAHYYHDKWMDHTIVWFMLYHTCCHWCAQFLFLTNLHFPTVRILGWFPFHCKAGRDSTEFSRTIIFPFLVDPSSVCHQKLTPVTVSYSTLYLVFQLWGGMWISVSILLYFFKSNLHILPILISFQLVKLWSFLFSDMKMCTHTYISLHIFPNVSICLSILLNTPTD